MPRLLSIGTALAVAAVSVATVAPIGAANAKTATPKTTYIMSGSAYGTSVTGGSVPANVGKTGWVVMGCDSRPGRTHSTDTAGVGNGVIPDLQIGAVGGSLHSRYEQHGLGVVSNEHIASITIGDSSLGELKIGAVTSMANAWHNSSGYHTKHSFNIASIGLAAGGSALPSLPLNELTQLLKGVPLNIPGLANISLSKTKDHVTSHYGFAQTQALKIYIIPTNTTVIVGDAQARIRDTQTPAIFRGNSALVDESSALDGVVTLGPNTNLPMPCDGTDGKVKTNDLASLPIGGTSFGLDVGAGTTANSAAFNRNTGTAYQREASQLANINIADQIVITALKAQANITENRWGKIRYPGSGTTAGSITVAGQAESLPDLGGFSSSGFGINTNVVTKTQKGRSIDVIGLQILLGPLATINLAHAHAEIREGIEKYRR